MFPEPATSIVTGVVVLLAFVVGVIAAVRRIVRAVQLRDAPPTGLLRAGAPEGTDDPGVAAQRAEGRYAWTRISGGGF